MVIPAYMRAGMASEPPPLPALDLNGTSALGLGGAPTAVRAARLDAVGVVALGMTPAAAALPPVGGVSNQRRI